MPPQLPTTQVSFNIVTELEAAGNTVNLILEQKQEGGITILSGGMIQGQRLPVVALLQELDLPMLDSLRNLAITKLDLTARPHYHTYTFEAGIENVWSIDLEFGTIRIASLNLHIESAPQESSFSFAGEFDLFEKKLTVEVARRVSRLAGEPPENLWQFTATALEIPLGQLISDTVGGNLDDTFGLQNLTISKLSLQFTQGVRSSYCFQGAVDWNTGLDLGGGEPLQVQAAVKVEKESGRTVEGEITGMVQASIPFFESLELSVGYQFGQKKNLIFRLQLGKLIVSATYESGTGDKILIFKTEETPNTEGTITFGELITSFINLVDPSIDEFELDEPWNALIQELNKISLSKIKLTINLTQKILTFSYALSPQQRIGGFISISSIGLTYQQSGTTRPTGVDIIITGTLLGKLYTDDEPLKWDALNESPPPVPGQGKTIFDLQYLGVGQRVAFASTAELVNIAAVMQTLRATMTPPPEPQDKNKNPLAVANEGGEVLRFDPRSSWLIGAQFTLLETVDLSLIFNDPLIYGARIALSGEKAKSFAGLQFEILYRRISDTIGVYHFELVLPDAMRQLQFGAVALTLPTVVVDIYTNGDFKLDFGFPRKFDFSRSFAIEIFPFTGAGGFYFNKLSAETATSVPRVTNGKFNPVIEFGLGFKIGWGKTFNQGPLKAELSITVQGILEGVIAWFYPSNYPTLPSDQYYRIQGGVAIVGRLWGVVDFSVIQVEVEVTVRVAVLFIVEAYKPILLTLSAEVSVRASIKILFIRIHFSFNFTLTQDFTLGSAQPTPWEIDTSSPKEVMNFAPRGLRASEMEAIAFESAVPPDAIPVEAVPIDEPTDATPGGSVSPPASLARAPSPPPLSSHSRSFSTSASPPPPSSTPVSRAASSEIRAAAPEVRNTSFPTPLSWQAVKVQEIWRITKGEPSIDTDPYIVANLYFQPAFTRDSGGVQGVALLLMENSIAPDADGHQNYDVHAANKTTDFDVLVQALLTWAICAYYIPAGTTPTTPEAIADVIRSSIPKKDLENLYQMYLEDDQDEAALFSFENLIAFLAHNFKFNITDCRESTSGTIFPMLPQLAMKLSYEADVRHFDGAQYHLTPADRTDFAFYFQQLKASHGSTVEQSSTNTTERTSRNSEDTFSVAAFIFVDYFKLLMRSAVQQAIDYLQDNNLSEVSLMQLLERLNRGGQLNHIAGMASRFLLHGLRLPMRGVSENQRRNSTRDTSPLYRELGQQFAVPTPATSPTSATSATPSTPATSSTNSTNSNEISITLSNPNALTWIEFTDYDEQTGHPQANSPMLVYSLTLNDPNNLVTLITQLRAVTAEEIEQRLNGLLNDINLLSPYIDQPHRFSLQQRTVWQASNPTRHPSGKYSILQLPDDLLAYLEKQYQQNQRTGVSFTLKHGRPQQGNTELKPADLTTLNDYTWATRLNVTLRRVPSPDGTKLLETTYILAGTDEAGKDILEDLWHHMQETDATPLLYLLHSSGDGKTQGLTNAAATSLLLRTNLSDQTSTALPPNEDRPRGLYNASLEADGKNFIKLLWKASTVTPGGYYLSYNTHNEDTPPGLPEAIFTDGTSASLVLLILLSDATSPQLAHHFHNCLVLWDSVDLEDSVLFAESSNLVKVLSVPPGNLGFCLSRTAPVVTANETGIDELESLYHLLGFQLQETTGFPTAYEGLPVGPAGTADSNKWLYERVIPIYKFAKTSHTHEWLLNRTPNAATLPPARLDPYAGIVKGEGAKGEATTATQVQITFRWQDVYGNRLINNGTSKNWSVQYFDRLLGINQWPSVAESYRFQKSNSTSSTEQTVDLILELVFDQARYIPTPGKSLVDTQNNIKTARATYQQVYYQIVQPDVTFTVTTSVLPNQTGQLPKTPLLQFIATAYRYLSSLEQIKAYVHSIQAGDTLQSVGQSYRVSIKELITANEAALTQAGISENNPTVLLNPSVPSLVIPDRISVSTELPAVKKIDSPTTLIEVVKDLKTKVATDLNTSLESIRFSLSESRIDHADPQKSVQSLGEVAAVAIANQSFIGLLVKGAEILPASFTVASLAELAGITPTNLVELLGSSIDTSSILSNDQVAQVLNQITSFSLGQEDWKTLLTKAANQVSLRQIQPNETFYTLASRFTEAIRKPVSVTDVAALIAHRPGFLNSDQPPGWLIPPIAITQTLQFFKTESKPENKPDNDDNLRYPTDLIFPVTVQVATRRADTWVDQTSKAHTPEIAEITAFLSPKTTRLSAGAIGTDAEIASLRQFATDFQNTFPSLHLAVGKETPHKHSTSSNSDTLDAATPQPLWAVHFGKKGISYNIEAQPYFFSPTPLANKLLAGEVSVKVYQSGSDQPLTNGKSKRVEAIDLNVLAHDFLVAVEDFLEPAIALPAMQFRPEKVEAILQHKETLADAIYYQVKHILEDPNSHQAELEERRQIAANALRQQLRNNLVKGYDIETIIQCKVSVTLAQPWGEDHQTYQTAPRLFGQPVVKNLKQRDESDPKVFHNIVNPDQYNFSLSAAKLPLDSGQSYLTFFFDTKSPEKFEDICLELTYQVNELEHDIASIPGFDGYQASAWLSFILPIDSTQPFDPIQDANKIGDVDIPIPLRTYPMPPSLVLHRAEADPDSLKNLAQVREWQYTYVYEHLDVAQDAIETKIHYNTIPTTSTSQPLKSTPHPLFAPLVNFAHVYPQLLPDLRRLTDANPDGSKDAINSAIDVLEQLTGEIAKDWRSWAIQPNDHGTTLNVADYEINEQIPLNDPAAKVVEITRMNHANPFPRVTLPKYRPAPCEPTPSPDNLEQATYEFKSATPEEITQEPIFGESSIPDRILSIPDLDAIQQQNVWGSIWLTRNKHLSNSFATNSAFVYQTPEVRFSNMVTPLLVNTQRWDIALLDSPDGDRVKRSLPDHLEQLMTVPLPATSDKPYDLQIACRYAFALATSTDNSSDLLSTLPVLLTPRFTIAQGTSLLEATETIRNKLSKDIEAWQSGYQPVQNGGMYLFSLSIFSNLASNSNSEIINMPLLRIDYLVLRLEHIIS